MLDVSNTSWLVHRVLQALTNKKADFSRNSDLRLRLGTESSVLENTLRACPTLNEDAFFLAAICESNNIDGT